MLVSDILDDVKKVIGNCDDTKALSALTDAVITLANKKYYDIMTGYVDICALSDGKTVTLPRDVEVPLAVNIGGHPAFFRNRWYEFHLNGMGSDKQVRWAWDDYGEFPVFMDIINASNLVAVADLKTDLGTLLRIFGEDDAGNWIRTQNPDGSWSDGFVLPLNLLTDFPSGIITPDTNRIFSRIFKTANINTLVSSGSHQLTTGAVVMLSLLNAPMPAPLVNGASYYIEAVDDTHVALYATRSGALTRTGGIIITSASSVSQLSLTDKRIASVLTKFNTVAAHGMRTGMLVNFSAVAFPAPLDAATDYYAKVIDANNFTVHASVDDAESDVNPIDVSTPGTTVVANAKQSLAPITHFDFGNNHNFRQGDAVMVQNTTGSLPQPLLEGVNYYVRYLTAKRITLHPSAADAAAGSNPIIFTTAGTGTTIVVKQMVASASVGNSNNITCVGHNLAAGDFIQFASTGALPTPIVQNTAYQVGTPLSSDTFTCYTTDPAALNITAPGSGQLYVVISRVATVGFTSQWNTDATTLASGAVVRLDSTAALPACSPGVDETTDYYVRKINDATIELYTTLAYANDTAIRLSTTRKRAANVATLETLAAHGLVTGDFVDVSGMATTLSGVLATCTITGGGTGYTNGESATITDAAGHTAKGLLTVVAGAVTAITITQGGIGFTAGGALTITGDTSASVDAVVTAGLVAATNNGILSLVSITAGGSGYTAGETITIKDGSGHTAKGTVSVSGGVVTSIAITSGGIGFAVDSALTTKGETSGATNCTAKVTSVLMGADASASTYNGTRKQVTVVNTTKFTYACGGLNEPTTADTGGSIVISDVKVNSLGTGTLFLVLRRSVTVQVFSSLMRLSASDYLQDGATIRFETDGTLPAPLATLTDYKLSLTSDGFLQVKTMLGVDVTLTNIGSGKHDFTITRTFGVTLPTTLVVTGNNYENGDLVQLSTTGTLPAGLAISTNYYLRRISDDSVEIYDTANNAKDTANTTGRIVPTNTGTGIHSMVQTLTAFKVKKITRIQKGLSNGFIKLYAFDTGRTQNLALIGNYFPDEVEPRYRRIKVGQNCPWIRMRFKRRVFKLRSLDDFIPFVNKVPIVFMLRALKLYSAEFSDQGKEFEKKAVEFMDDEDASSAGPNVDMVQVNEDVYTNPDDFLT